MKCTLGEKIEAILAVGLFDAMKANSLAKEAFKISDNVGLSGRHNGMIDAYRHCYWSCRMSQEIGKEQAMKIGNLHEECANNQPECEKTMDLTNNAIGRYINDKGKGNCKDNCLLMVLHPYLHLNTLN